MTSSHLGPYFDFASTISMNKYTSSLLYSKSLSQRRNHKGQRCKVLIEVLLNR